MQFLFLNLFNSINYFKNLINNQSKDLLDLQKNMKYYFFNTNLLEIALTHRSQKNLSKENYERLEFLGDAIIDHIVSHWLYNKYSQSNEGDLTKKRAAMVNRDFLSIIGKKLNLIQLVKIDNGVNIKDDKVSNNIAADTYESIVGAVYLDGGYKNAEKFVKRTLCLAESLTNENANYKGQLIEFCHKKKFSMPDFSIVETHGPDHERTFTVKVSFNDKYWLGIGTSKKNAEQNAAHKAIESLRN